MKSIIYYLPTVTLLAVAAAVLIATKAFAYEVPAFSSCISPEGELIASYDTGVHGIIGDYTLHTGSDKVYQLSESSVIQCYCDEENNGIQTNWWKIPEMSEEEIAAFVNEGWILAPNGADWGLSEGPYLAKNSTFDCTQCVTPTPTTTLTPTPTVETTPTPTPTLTPTLTPTPEAGSSGQVQSASSSTSDTPAPQGQVQAGRTEVKGLANTGSSVELLLTAIGSAVTLLGSFFLKKTLE